MPHGMKCIYIDEEMHSQAKVYSAEEKISIKEVVENALDKTYDEINRDENNEE